MTNEPSWDDAFASEHPAPTPGEPQVPLTRRHMREAEERERAHRRPVGSGRQRQDNAPFGELPKRKRSYGCLWILLAFAVILGGGAFAVWNAFEPQVRQVMGWELPIDYEGDGNGEAVDIVISQGEIGKDIATTLHDAGVTMTFEAFYTVLLEEEPTFQPGTYSLEKEMSAAAALAALQDPANQVLSKATIIEGTTLPSALTNLSHGTGVPLAEFQAAAADLPSLGLPGEAPSLEGYLFPATYTFEPGMTAHDILQVLVNRAFEALDGAGVAAADRHRVLTMAALVQKEGGPEKDFPQVARVFTNRLEQGMLLQSDATVSYGIGGPEQYGAEGKSIFTEDAERADTANPYNTYVHAGLPVGPISAPGDAAIQAALHPADGPWLYFVLVNGETGETTFSTTGEEHAAAVKVWQQWLADNPDWQTGG